MTNKEAIEQLLAIKNFGGFTDKDRQALNIAIKALEQIDIKLIEEEAYEQGKKDGINFAVKKLLENQ